MATFKRSTRKLSTQASKSSTAVLVMPQVPIYSNLARQVTGLADAELSTLCDAYGLDGIDPNQCPAFQRRNIANLQERCFLEFNEMAEVWRATEVGEGIVKTFCNPDLHFDVAPSRTARVLQFPSSPISSNEEEARR